MQLMSNLIEVMRIVGEHQRAIVEMLEDIMEMAESHPEMRDLITPHVTHILEVLPYFGAVK